MHLPRADGPKFTGTAVAWWFVSEVEKNSIGLAVRWDDGRTSTVEMHGWERIPETLGRFEGARITLILGRGTLVEPGEP